MIQEQEAAGLISRKLFLTRKKINTADQKNLYRLSGQLNTTLKKQVLNQNYTILKHSLAVIEKLYLDGNSKIQHCIENIIVFSFFDFVSLQPKDNRKKLHALFPTGIYSAYIRQVNSCAH